MGEPIGVSLKVGGKITVMNAEKLLYLINEEISDLTGPISLKELRKESIWQGTANYGQCDDTLAFCRENKLSFILQADAKYEYDGDITVCIGGKDFIMAANQNGDPLVYLNMIKPYCDLLLALYKHGNKALPLFMNIEDEDFHDMIVTAIKTPSKLYGMLKKELSRLLPVIPKLPPLIIV